MVKLTYINMLVLEIASFKEIADCPWRRILNKNKDYPPILLCKLILFY